MFSHISDVLLLGADSQLAEKDMPGLMTIRNLVLSTNAQTIINADTDLTAKVTAAITAGWSIIYQTR